MKPLSSPVARIRPSGDQATAWIVVLCPSNCVGIARAGLGVPEADRLAVGGEDHELLVIRGPGEPTGVDTEKRLDILGSAWRPKYAPTFSSALASCLLYVRPGEAAHAGGV